VAPAAAAAAAAAAAPFARGPLAEARVALAAREQRQALVRRGVVRVQEKLDVRDRRAALAGALDDLLEEPPGRCGTITNIASNNVSKRNTNCLRVFCLVVKCASCATDGCWQ